MSESCLMCTIGSQISAENETQHLFCKYLAFTCRSMSMHFTTQCAWEEVNFAVFFFFFFFFPASCSMPSSGLSGF